MPGFNIIGSEVDHQGLKVPSANIETRRTHRWVFALLQPMTDASLVILKKAARPSFNFDEVEMHHDQEVSWFAGKQKWDAIELEWYDAEQDPEVSGGIYDWLNAVTDLRNVKVSKPSKFPSGYKSRGELHMTDGQGSSTEKWTIHNVWPSKVNWNTLDYTSSEIQTIAVTIRYDRATRLDQ
jgi:hypothetical protein